MAAPCVRCSRLDEDLEKLVRATEGLLCGVASRDEVCRVLVELRAAQNARGLPPHWKLPADVPEPDELVPVAHP